MQALKNRCASRWPAVTLSFGKRMIVLTPDLKKIKYNNEVIGDLTLIETPETLEPHVVWNKKATNRGIYEAFVYVIGLLRQVKHVIILTSDKYSNFFDGFAKRGVLRPVGIIEDAPHNIYIYQAKRIV